MAYRLEGRWRLPLRRPVGALNRVVRADADGSLAELDESEALETCTTLTIFANDDVAQLHDRTPVTVAVSPELSGGIRGTPSDPVG